MKEKKSIKQYKNNNELDMEKIIDEYSGYVYKIVTNMAIIVEEDIEEIISDTFFVLWKNQQKLDEEKILSSYIAGIARNLVKEKSKVIKVNANICDYENTIEENTNIDMLCEQREKISVIEKCIKDMKENDKLIFNFYYYSSMKITEIANVLNISEFNVKSRLCRIRKKVRKELLKGGYSDEQ